MEGQHLLVTGGAGFIGANLVRWLVGHHRVQITVVDKLTYAGNRRYIGDLVEAGAVDLVVADITDRQAMEGLFERRRFDGVIHLAAESHVDRSIAGPEAFVMSNVVGTFCLLECARQAWRSGGGGRFLHVSTDEVYGSIAPPGRFSEATAYDPSSPYAASKGASDHFARAYQRTYGMDVVITNCSNNFGPYQYPEKLIPLTIAALRDGRSVPVYGDGQQVRDWLYVEDHCRALVAVFDRGRSGVCYNVGGHNEWANLDLVEQIGDLVDQRLGRPRGRAREQIEFVADRPGHDRRYAIDAGRITRELGWQPQVDFQTALDRTVGWYLDHLPSLWGM